LFGGVTAPDVVDAAKTAGGPSLDKRRIELPAAHIKTVGTHTVSVRLHADVSAPIIVEVTPES
jgi:large subunit ribosomal protein L9